MKVVDFSAEILGSILKLEDSQYQNTTEIVDAVFLSNHNVESPELVYLYRWPLNQMNFRPNWPRGQLAIGEVPIPPDP